MGTTSRRLLYRCCSLVGMAASECNDLGLLSICYLVQSRAVLRVLCLAAVAQAVFQAVGYCGFILFALRFPRNEIEPRWRWVQQTLPVIAMAVLIIQLCAFLPVFGFQVEWAARLNFFAGVAINGIVLVILFIRYHEHSLEDRHRIRFVFWSCVIGLGAFILAESYVATSLWPVRLPDWVIY